MAGDSADATSLSREELLDVVDDLIHKLGVAETGIATLERRIIELQGQLSELRIARALREASLQVTRYKPVSFQPKTYLAIPAWTVSPLGLTVDSPRVAPLMVPWSGAQACDFLEASSQVEPPELRRIAPSSHAGELLPLPVIPMQQRMQDLRRNRQYSGRRFGNTWQEVATVAVPVLLASAMIAGAIRLTQSDDSTDSQLQATGIGSPTATATPAQPTQNASVDTATTSQVHVPGTPATYQVQPTVSPTPRSTPTLVPTPISTTPPTKTKPINPSHPTSTTIATSTVETETISSSTVEATENAVSVFDVPTATSVPAEANPTETSAPTPPHTAQPIAPVPGGVGSTSAEIEQTFGALETVNTQGDSVYQDSTVLVHYMADGRAWQVTFELSVDELVFDRAAADDLAAFYRPPGAELVDSESVSPGLERLTYATPGLAASIGDLESDGHDASSYIEEFHFDPESGRVLEVVTRMGTSP